MFVFSRLIIVSVIFSSQILHSRAYTEEALADEILSLPGAENINISFKQFSGYLTIPGKNGDMSKHMHYWFVESASQPASDPLAFWTNGGPGCSGLIGMLTEQGPFVPNEDMTISINPHSWNSVSNFVFIESPAGVGFSYSDQPRNDYTTGDEQTATDNYNLILAFLERFPEYSQSSLYISSESYGGHYMPTLAKKIVDMNSAGTSPKINFKGFAVGNPYTNVYSGTPAMIDTIWGHQLAPKPLYDRYNSACNGKVPRPADCAKAAAEMLDSYGSLNPYALDYPICNQGSTNFRGGLAQRLWQLNHQLQSFGIEPKTAGVKSNSQYQPCEDNYAATYLNQPQVKAALHVATSINWDECSYKVEYNMTDSDVSMAPIYNYLIDGGYDLDILVYSGDDDGVCSTIGTQSWIWNLGYTPVPTTNWVAYSVDQQTAGYLTRWKGTKLGFLTVHGAGHEVPTYKPEVALDMWKNYLAGTFAKF